MTRKDNAMRILQQSVLSTQVDVLEKRCAELDSLARDILATITVNREKGTLKVKNDCGSFDVLINGWWERMAKINEN